MALKWWQNYWNDINSKKILYILIQPPGLTAEKDALPSLISPYLPNYWYVTSSISFKKKCYCFTVVVILDISFLKNIRYAFTSFDQINEEVISGLHKIQQVPWNNVCELYPYRNYTRSLKLQCCKCSIYRDTCSNISGIP